MELRPATLDDADALAGFARDAFDAAFGHLYKPEDLQAFFDEWRTPERYRASVEDPDTAVQLALDNGEIAAYCLLVRGYMFDEHPEPRPANPAFLSQLYCAKKSTGRGLGAALMDWALAQTRTWDGDAITLSVFSENFGAQRFYQRHGFHHVANIDFWVGNHRDDEFLYELRL
ncbi:GNAT family N-acetyltransferase [Alteraurantiacibacter aquimixticola]|uniref:GNAT family N-acetyltransferase n=1 Tax=Alteraurantiacibacter aquimixticola TaxID=2489173 RepID=A0A4T3F6D5_9SPHN|nr:GNAT family N-acetyltransferase [Alteraurantiacibacter aquimixticola]